MAWQDINDPVKREAARIQTEQNLATANTSLATALGANRISEGQANMVRNLISSGTMDIANLENQINEFAGQKSAEETQHPGLAYQGVAAANYTNIPGFATPGTGTQTGTITAADIAARKAAERGAAQANALTPKKATGSGTTFASRLRSGTAQFGNNQNTNQVLSGSQNLIQYENPFTTNLNLGSSGNDVATLQRLLNSQGANLQVDGRYGPLTQQAVKAFQTKYGLTADGIFGPKSSKALTDLINATGGVGTGGQTPSGRIDPNTPFDLTSPTSSTFDTSALEANYGFSDVLGKRQSYEDTINAYLKQQADAYTALNNLKASKLQGDFNIMYGKGGAGGSDADLQGREQQMFDQQMAFKELPAQIALNNAEVALSLFKQSPQYINETQARDTAFNIIQQYPDLGVQYNPALDAKTNLALIQQALPNSPRYQAQNTQIVTNPLTGEPMMLNKLPGGGFRSSPIVQGGGGGGTPVGGTWGKSSSIPIEIRSAIGNINGNEYIDMGKLTSNQIPFAQRVATSTGLPLLSQDDANKLQEAQASFKGADSLINQIKKLTANVLKAENTPQSQAVQSAKLKMIEFAPWTSTDNTAKQFIDARKSLLSLITRAAGEKGVLTDLDVQRIANALPGYSDNATLAAQKAANMSSVIQSVLQGAIESYIGGATGSGFSGGNNDPLGIR